MTNEEWFKKEDKKPICVGIGLVALDLIIEDNRNSEPQILAGGSCGNVLTVLSYLKWDSYPIAHLRDNIAAKILLSDLKQWEVKTDLLYTSKNGNTPIIIEKFGTNNKGKPWHRFETRCPYCGLRFSKYKSINLNEVNKINDEIPVSEVFYFDRVQKSALQLAMKSKREGSLIVFEPSEIIDENLFLKCVEVADIVKYSRERFGNIKTAIDGKNIPLEIITLDEEGLTYRFKSNEKLEGEWKKIEAYPVKKVRDSAGAGDWCTAGIIHILGKNGREGFVTANEKNVQKALEFGQLLSAFKCYYEGARGCMYNVSDQEFKAIIYTIWEGKDPLGLIERFKKETKNNFITNVCPFCGEE